MTVVLSWECCTSGEVVIANELRDDSAVRVRFLEKATVARPSREIRWRPGPLKRTTELVVRARGDGTGSQGRDDARGDCLLSGGERRLCSLHGGDLLPERVPTLAPAVAAKEGEDVASRPLHGTPAPMPVRLLAHTVS